MDVDSAKKGLGQCVPDGCTEALACGVYDMLRWGSPRLAWAVANGVPLVPYTLPVQATFADTSVSLVPDQGNQEKIVWDLLVRRMRFQIQNGNTGNSFDFLNNFFFQYQSGIDVKLKTIGAGGGYNPIPVFIPINLAARECDPWVLTWTNAWKMDFLATVTLPFAPITVTFTFEGTTCYWPELIDMPARFALECLAKKGFACESYQLCCPQ